MHPALFLFCLFLHSPLEEWKSQRSFILMEPNQVALLMYMSINITFLFQIIEFNFSIRKHSEIGIQLDLIDCKCVGLLLLFVCFLFGMIQYM